MTAAALACAAIAAAPAAAHADAAVSWNQFLLDLQATPNVQPPTVHPTYELAVMHAAIYDAVVASRTASRAAAADAAARDTLVVLYPSQAAAIDQRYAAELGAIRSGRARSQGVRVGRRAAAQILRARRNDGSAAQPLPFTPGTQPGDYQLTPPAFGQPVFTHWSDVRPFVLRRRSGAAPVPRPGDPVARAGRRPPAVRTRAREGC